MVAEYAGPQDVPQPGDDDAPRPVDPNEMFENDPQTVTTCYFFLKEFGMAPDVTLRQDETLLSDITRMHRQMGYRQWAKQVNYDTEADDQAASFVGVPDWKSIFGVEGAEAS